MTAAVSRVTLVEGEDFKLRPGRESDRNLVLDSWIKCHRRNCYPEKRCKHYGACSCPQILDAESYRAGQEWLVKQLLERCALYVACLPSEEDFVMAWSVTSDRAVHYCWTRHAFRRKGLCNALLKPYLGKPTTYTHPISVGADWMGSKWSVPDGFVFDPFHAYRIAAFPKPRDNT